MTQPILNLEGMDGNAFGILGQWKQAAREAGWTPEQISTVMAEAMAGDYDHLLQTVMANSEGGE
jgi:hypothetical protein